MTTATNQRDVLIIGAGLSGLSAASELNKIGLDVLLVDKGRGLGGRLAGRRIGDASFDHGAQFMTARDPRFTAQVHQWVEAGVAKEWYSSIPGEPNSHARYRGVPTMTAIAKHLAVPLKVELATTVVAISADNTGWQTKFDNGNTIRSRSLLITTPVPQTIALLNSGNIQLTAANQARLARIKYECCIAVMAILDQPSAITPPGAMAIETGPIAWIGDNQQKEVSALPAVTIHGRGDFSAHYFDNDRDQAANILIDAAKPYLGAAVVKYQVHGWRYSKPVVVDQAHCMVASESTNLPPLVLAGDAFFEPRVEGAVRSGWAAAEELSAALK